MDLILLSSRMTSHIQNIHNDSSIIRDAGTGGGGQEGQLHPCLLLGGARGAKVPFKYKEYYITVNFQGALS